MITTVNIKIIIVPALGIEEGEVALLQEPRGADLRV